MKRNDAPKKQPVPFGINRLREDLIPSTPPSDTSASCRLGLPSMIMRLKSIGKIPPKTRDMNQILYELSSLSRWESSGALNSFDKSFCDSIGGYPKAALLVGDDGITIYKNTVDSNFSNPNANGQGWVNIDQEYLKSDANLAEIKDSGIQAMDAAISNLGFREPTGASKVGVKTEYQRLFGRVIVDEITDLQSSNNDLSRAVEINAYNANYLEEFMTPERSHADAFEAAFAAMATNAEQARSHWLQLPRMIFYFDRNVIIPNNVLVIMIGAGNSEVGTIIKVDSNAKLDPDKGLFDYQAKNGGDVGAPCLFNMQLDGRQGGDKFARCHGIRVMNGAKMFWQNVEIQGFDGAGLLLDSCQDSDFHNVSFHENGRSVGEWNDFNNMSDPTKMQFAQLHLATTNNHDCNHLRFWGGMWERQRSYASCYIIRSTEIKFYSQHHEHHGAFESVKNYPTAESWDWGTMFYIVGAEASIDRAGIYTDITNGVKNLIESPETYGFFADISNCRRGAGIYSVAGDTTLNLTNSEVRDIDLHFSQKVKMTGVTCRNVNISNQRDMFTSGLTCQGDFTITAQPAYSPSNQRNVHQNLLVTGDLTALSTPPTGVIENIQLIDPIIGGDLNYSANTSSLIRPIVRGETNINPINPYVYIPGSIDRHELWYPSINSIAGTHPAGSICWNSARINLKDPAGWICSETGSPGTWDPFGAQPS